jgi:hypothetical protein
MRLEGPNHGRFDALADAATAWAAPVIYAARRALPVAATATASSASALGAAVGAGDAGRAEANSDAAGPCEAGAHDAASACPLQRLFTGCVASLPGASAQGWHADGSLDGLYNVFVPLVDLPSRAGGGPTLRCLGPTQFAPGTHVHRGGKARLLPPVPGARARWEIVGGDNDCNSEGAKAATRDWLVTAAPLAAGDLVIFDYRVLHRGLANGTPNQVRSVFYVALSAAPGTRCDAVNTPLVSLAAAAAAATQQDTAPPAASSSAPQ